MNPPRLRLARVDYEVVLPDPGGGTVRLDPGRCWLRDDAVGGVEITGEPSLPPVKIPGAALEALLTERRLVFLSSR